jgi:hypothetical protein
MCPTNARRQRMFKDIEISPEVARLVQRNCREKELPFECELARYVVEEAVVGLDPELELIIEADSALADIAPLARSLGVNDVVVNGRHIHVSLLDSDGAVTVKNVLVGTDYLKSGTLVVQLDAARSGSVVGHIDELAWQNAPVDKGSSDQKSLPFRPESQFDLQGFFKSFTAVPEPKRDLKHGLKADDYLALLKEPLLLPTDKQKQIVSALLDPAIRENVALVANRHQERVSEMLHDAAVWNARVNKFCQHLARKFPSLDIERTKAAVLRAGEELGGQTELLEFRKAVLAEVTGQALSEKLTASAKAQLASLIDRVSAGASALAAVKQMVKNPLCVDLAEAINKQRDGLISFASATAEEFGMAFRSLALQPAYATHSQTENLELEAVNEALALLEAAELVEQIKELEI